MAIFLKNSLFIHIPKTGGRWVDKMIEQHVKNYKYWGDKTYDGHASPPAEGKQVFAFVREPAAFCDSLWRHRSIRKANKFGETWNWQEYLELEYHCQSSDYETFMNNCANRKDAVAHYYRHYIGRYMVGNNVQVGKTESLCADLIRFLTENGEDFNGPAIKSQGNNIIGAGKTPSKLTKELRLAVNKANKELCDTYGYKYE